MRIELAKHASRGLGALLACGLAGAVAAQDAASIAAQGNGKGAAACQSCHEVDGSGQAQAGFPRLAGLDALYLQRQLDAFAAGARDNPVMKVEAGALTGQEREAMAVYFSRMPAVATPAVPQATPLVDPDHLGETLATRGRWSLQVPACAQCHGPGGVGVGTNFPPLAGQSATYLAAQLKAFRQGTRHNDPMGLMRHVSQSLSDHDIDAVAHWFAAQPLPARESRP